MSIQKQLEPCPRHYKIIDDRLRLFLNDDDTNVLELWNKEDEARCLANANQYWAELRQETNERTH